MSEGAESDDSREPYGGHDPFTSVYGFPIGATPIARIPMSAQQNRIYGARLIIPNPTRPLIPVTARTFRAQIRALDSALPARRTPRPG